MGKTLPGSFDKGIYRSEVVQHVLRVVLADELVAVLLLVAKDPCFDVDVQSLVIMLAS